MAASAKYDTIGVGYARRRRPDPRIAATIEAAVGPTSRVVNVGSGAGSYEPRGIDVIAVEPSQVMIDQRPVGAAPVVKATAEFLPVRTGAADVALAVLTLHHWTDPAAGLVEMARVAPRQVIVTWDPEIFSHFWLVAEYLPEVAVREAEMATLKFVESVLEVDDVLPVLVPADCVDGFCGAYWRRPEAYLVPTVRRAISALAGLDQNRVAAAMVRLTRDLEEGAWRERHGDLLRMESIDLGYRIAVCRGPRS